jgi:hypothetical protein
LYQNFKQDEEQKMARARHKAMELHQFRLQQQKERSAKLEADQAWEENFHAEAELRQCQQDEAFSVYARNILLEYRQ